MKRDSVPSICSITFSVACRALFTLRPVPLHVTLWGGRTRQGETPGGKADAAEALTTYRRVAKAHQASEVNLTLLFHFRHICHYVTTRHVKSKHQMTFSPSSTETYFRIGFEKGKSSESCVSETGRIATTSEVTFQK